MFDVSSDEISQLNDADLRELVGRLCEAELVSRGFSPAAVTWGGNQTATDGGLDVRVALEPTAAVEGFVPRPSTGFQVKTPDMPKSAILDEMRPKGVVRPIFQELSREAGAYVIVSSHGSTSDRALRSRRAAMREALGDVPGSDTLQIDFFDRTRLASWVRLHPGLITWVKERIGRAFAGWRPYGSWTGSAEGLGAEYLIDEKLRLHLGNHIDDPAQPIADAIDELRDELSKSGKIMRLVGLSGVGKTRFVQALFDDRIGNRPLPPSLAVYTNLSDNPNPLPVGLASDLIANRTRTILIIDNCPPDLHQRLADICAVPGSTVSVLSVEYDVRDDQPEGTQVVTLETSSPGLIQELVARRYAHISEVDTRTIAEASGGNARIAIALAETVGRAETISDLSDDALFQRLFRQRHDPNDALLLAGQVCSIVYSFQGEALTGDEAELPRLASLVGQSSNELYRHVSELLRRDLTQKRGVWRAVLPHAVANRLAALALENIPYDLIHQQIVEGGTEHLARSFSRRLSYLHQHPEAVAIVERWLAPGGLLGDVSELNELGRAMFANAAPVLTEAALLALERAENRGSSVAVILWCRHRSLIRSLAYDPVLFERSVRLLTRAALENVDGQDAKEASNVFASLFTIYLSGTHATIKQRLDVIEPLIRADDLKRRALGLLALDSVLETTHFSSVYPFEFGARSRDYGFRPRSNDDVAGWYGEALTLIRRLALIEGTIKQELRDLIARNLRGLWTSGHLTDELDALVRLFAAEGFWREGWTACRQTMRFDRTRLTPTSLTKLAALADDLKPSKLPDRVRAAVLGDSSGGFDIDDIAPEADYVGAVERREAAARDLGETVAHNDEVFAELLPDLLRGGNRVWSFGRGFANASHDRNATWQKLVYGLGDLPPEQRNVQFLRGYLAEVWDQDRNLAQDLLDAALVEPNLKTFFPLLQTAVQIDARGVGRLRQAIGSGAVSTLMFANLAVGRTPDQMAAGDLRDLLLLILERDDGFDVVLDILAMRLYSNRQAKRAVEPELLEAGRELIRRVQFKKNNQRDDYQLAEVARECLNTPDASTLAAQLTRRLLLAVATYETYAFDNDDLLRALLQAQPLAVLDALFQGEDFDRNAGISIFEHLHDYQANPADEISSNDLISWCDNHRELRYELAASFISFRHREAENGPVAWSEHAKMLLAHAPNRRAVLASFVERFRPSSWGGSRATLIEANARLLDSLQPEVSAELSTFIAEAKGRLATVIADERKWENLQSRDRDERFE
jgi:hypothetical protein